ncbi:hypothetical protein F5890DRAFT_1524983 [Lentinula detonsa]|uniref:Uncharacterized protein n=1 Tax=Lentinula detonsa TaxID=2804962 RepID=A0AA38PX04_9AGAR|nr:hypothetical protein F5890DRAFT_1524983 [Lentinula detonsa]
MSICPAQSSCGHRSYLRRRQQREKIAKNVSKPDLALSTRERARPRVHGVEQSEESVTHDEFIDRSPPVKRSGKHSLHAKRSGKQSLHTMRHSSSFIYPSVPSPQTWYPSKRSSPLDLELEILPGTSPSVNVDSRDVELALSTASSMSSVAATTASSTSISVSASTSGPNSTRTSTSIALTSTSTSTSLTSLNPTSISTSASSIPSSTRSTLMSTSTSSSGSSSNILSTTSSSSPPTTLVPTSTLSSTASTDSLSSTLISTSSSASPTSSIPSSTASASSSTFSSMTTSTSPISTLASSSSISAPSTILLSSASPSSTHTSPSTALTSSLISSSSFTLTLTSSSNAAPSPTTTRSTFTYTPSLKYTSSPVTSSTPVIKPSLTPSLASSTNFSTNTGAIIGATIGGAVALVAAAFAIFLVCGRVRRNRSGQILAGGHGSQGGNRALGPVYTDQMGVVPLRKKVGVLARGFSLGGSSARPLNRTTSSVSSSAWRSPLSDEDGDVDYPGLHVPIPTSSTTAAPGFGFGFGEGSSSGHDHGSSSGHDHPSGSGESSGSTYNASSIQSSRSQAHNMPGFGQAAETMVGMASAMSPQPLSSHGHSTLLNQDRSHSSGTISSTKGNMNNNRVTNSAGDGSGSSNSHSNATKSGDQTARAPMMTVPIPKLKLNDRSAPPSRSTTPKSFKKGFIERLRGGRSSTQGTIQGSPSTAASTTPASSSYYPTYSTFPAQSSLLNPPLPLPDAPLEPPVLPFLQAPLPLPSPALTDDSRIAYTDGLLNPVHSTHAGEASANPVLHAGNDSSLSLGDHVDYSRPFGGFVFNRMDSSTTFTSADTRTTHPAVETPLYQQQPTDHSARNESFTTHIAVDDGDQGSYFPAG